MGRGGKGFLDAAGSRDTVIAVLASITGVYYLIVGLNNCTDARTNFVGVEEVLSMRHTLAGIGWHAINNPTVAWIAFGLIVMWELLTALVLLAAAVAWWRLVAGRPVRVRAVRLASLGWTMAVMLFLGGFLTIAGEWFRMWANEEVNATSAALQNFLVAAVGLILVHSADNSPSTLREGAGQRR